MFLLLHSCRGGKLVRISLKDIIRCYLKTDDFINLESHGAKMSHGFSKFFGKSLDDSFYESYRNCPSFVSSLPLVL